MNLKEKMCVLFVEIFSYFVIYMIQVSGCVNLIGEYIDYNDGFVLFCVIDYQIVISCVLCDDCIVWVIVVDYDNQVEEFLLDVLIVIYDSQQWFNYVCGVVKYLQQCNNVFGGVDMVISGNVLQGVGLSFFVLLEVVVGIVFQQFYYLLLDGV